MDTVILSLREELKKHSDEKVRQSGLRFFKEKVSLYGLKTTDGTRIAKEFYAKIKCREKREIFALCEELWRSGYMEESFVACNWSYALRKSYTADDFKVFEHWVDKYVTNWASCDTLCNHTIGTLVEMYPAFLSDLKRWARSKNPWMRRAAAVTLIVPARQGKFLPDIFEIATILLPDKEDLVQKGYGWMLKVASQPYQAEVFEFVMQHKATMPRTALRYAIEKMPANLKAEAMKKG